MSFLKKLGLVDEVEEEKPKGTSPKVVVVQERDLSAGAPSLKDVESPYMRDDSAGIDEAYQKVLTATNFDNTDSGKAIKKYYAPLQSLPMDENLKIKTAIMQAKAQEGLTDDKIVLDLTSTETALTELQEKLTQRVAQRTESEVTARQNKITELSAQINSLQQEMATLAAESMDAQGKIAQTQTNYTSAIQRRRNEIAGQQSFFSTLLKG
jgi:hypothetical protein